MEKKFDHSEKIKKENEQLLEQLKKVLKDKDTKDQLCQAKKAVVREHRDSDALLEELGTSYVDGFDDALRQFKKAYPDLDYSMFNIDAKKQATVQPVTIKSIDDLFANDTIHGDGESAPTQA